MDVAHSARLVGSADALDIAIGWKAGVKSHSEKSHYATAIFEPDRRAHRVLRFGVYASLLAFDSFIIAASILAANVLRFGDAHADAGVRMIDVLLPLYVPLAIGHRAYCSVLLNDWRASSSRALHALFWATAAMLLISFYWRAHSAVSREVSSFGVACVAALIASSRFMLVKLVHRHIPGRLYNEVLLVDDVEAPVAGNMLTVRASDVNIRPDTDDPEMLDRLGTLLANEDRVVVACSTERREAWADMLKGTGLRAELLMPELKGLEALTDQEGISTARCQDATTLVVARSPYNAGGLALKRLFDLCVSIAGLAILSPPLMLIALAIKLDSPGPVFFMQPRVGRANRLFWIYKFRTMHVAACDRHGVQSTQRNDRRVTRVGRVLRATSLDELPQLINVIRGEMGIVGPRPHALGSLAGEKLFWQVDKRYWGRHATRPGLTGLAQINGFRGATEVESDLVNRLRADLDYVRNCNLWRDLMIITATPKALFHKNAF